MKRIFTFAAVAVAALAICSCAGETKEKKNTQEAEEVVVVEEEVVVEEAAPAPEVKKEVPERAKVTETNLTLEGKNNSGLKLENTEITPTKEIKKQFK